MMTKTINFHPADSVRLVTNQIQNSKNKNKMFNFSPNSNNLEG